MKEIAYTVILPDGKKAIEVQKHCFDGIIYYYQSHTVGRLLNTDKYELEPNGMIKGRLAEW